IPHFKHRSLRVAYGAGAGDELRCAAIGPNFVTELVKDASGRILITLLTRSAGLLAPDARLLQDCAGLALFNFSASVTSLSIPRGVDPSIRGQRYSRPACSIIDPSAATIFAESRTVK